MSEETLYLDSSAIVKLVLPEPETAALVARLRSQPESVSSALARVEVSRALRRIGGEPAAWRQAELVLTRLALIRIDHAVLNRAATLDPPTLRSLDAIHLATALGLGDGLTGIVTYDSALQDAAGRSGVRVIAPRPEA